MRSATDTVLLRDGFHTWLQQTVEARRPAAAVRFGDGEARLLLADPECIESIAAAKAELRMQSGLAFSLQDILAIKEAVRSAHSKADVLGLRPRHRFNPHRSLMASIREMYDQDVAKGHRPPVALASCMLGHHALEILPRILAGRRVSVISCRDVKMPLEREWKLEDVAVYQVPSQYAMRDVDGAYEASMHDVPIWPDAHCRIASELKVRERGEVFLVGAGLFGKDICIRIREEGGIALDAGSALDRLAGKVTRGIMRRALDHYATGMRPDDIAARFRDHPKVQFDSETLPEHIVAAARTGLSSWQKRKLKARYRAVHAISVEAEIDDGRTPRTRVFGVAVGFPSDGRPEGLGIWPGGGGRSSLWRDALADMQRRGVGELTVACPDGERRPLATAATSIFPGARVSVVDRFEWATSLRKVVERQSPFPDQQAATTLVYLAINRALSKQVTAKVDSEDAGSAQPVR